MKRRIDLTHVFHGTYAAIAKELGYSTKYVSMVARGERHNVIIEHRLAQEVRHRQAAEARRARLVKMLRHENNRQ